MLNDVFVSNRREYLRYNHSNQVLIMHILLCVSRRSKDDPGIPANYAAGSTKGMSQLMAAMNAVQVTSVGG